MRKRWVIRVLVSLLLGVVINITVAWGLALTIGLPMFRGRGSGSFGNEPRSDWLRPVPEHWPPVAGWNRGDWWACAMIDQRATRDETERERHVFSTHWLRIVAWGWPVPAMGTMWTQELEFIPSVFVMPDQAEGFRGGIPLPTSMQRGPWVTRLPTMPMWPGFVINSLVYAAIGGVAVFGPGVARRVHRRRRGQCVVCGYELAGLARCPECGVPCGQPNRAPNGQIST